MHSIIYSLYMWLRLCIILVVFRTGLKVNVMRITLQNDNQVQKWTMYKLIYANSKLMATIFSYLDRITQRNSVVVNWMPGCCMPFRITTQLPYQ